jgi:aminoglycoside phosphotransferase (APT) family kinase protein
VNSGDLEDEHVLLDESGRISGIIDWGDSGLSDPATDFRGLYAWLGENFVRDVLAHYGCSWDSSFLEQVAFRARCNALTTYGYSLQGHGTSRANRLPMVRTAFGIDGSAC